jgi:anthranilate synthase component 2
MGARVLVIDNYDSFVYNLVQCIGELGAEPLVYRNDALTIDAVAGLEVDAIVVSPGPGRPADAGISTGVIVRYGETTPILGVCLGHQCIGAAYGGDIVGAPELMHGKTSWVSHSGAGVLAGLPDPFEATRYHSLVIERSTMPADLEVTAETADGVVMAVRHRRYPVEGVQFHPESILTRVGPQLVANFLALTTTA